ncbi:MAG: molybdenum cofactor biosynthesis protein MoaE [Pirellulales bacterium]
MLFVGTTRELTGDRRTAWLDYDAYAPLAEKTLTELAAEARRRWGLLDVAIEHRLGRVEIGAASVAIAVVSAHRRAAFEAGQWVIDELKRVVPIWKRETWADGTSEWQHPGA